ncbi:MAG: NOP5/NOP56 family protein [Halobacteriaceae archaeon]
MTEDGWFVGVDDVDGAARAIRDGRAADPRDWPAAAIAAGYADDEGDYYRRLHEAAMVATREAATEAETADDRQLVHAVRALDDVERTANELAERVAEWGGGLHGETGVGGVAYAREVADSDPGDDPVERRLVSLAERVVDLDGEAGALRRFLERRAPTVAPNLSALAGPVLAARLVALAGGLEALAKMPSGTVQVLGAEDALFAHLRGDAPSPKHGVIYAHEYVHGTRPEDRGSAARAVAGKLSIAARVDHYSGDRRPELETALDERMARIRSRADDEEEGDA